MQTRGFFHAAVLGAVLRLLRLRAFLQRGGWGGPSLPRRRSIRQLAESPSRMNFDRAPCT